MEQFKDGLGDAWATIARIVPQFITFLLILVIGYFIAKTLQKVLDGILERVGFDRWVERGGVKKALEKSQYDASSILAKVVFYLVMLFVLQLAFGIFGPNPVSALMQGVIAYLPNVLVAVLILVIGSAVAAAVKEIVEAALGGLSYGKMLSMAASVAIIVLALFAALDQLQIAPRIVTGLFYALLAIIVGSSVIALGGGGIPVAREYLQRASGKLGEQSSAVQQETQGSLDRIKQRVQERSEQAKPESRVR